MIRDPFVQELHKIREGMFKECGGDLRKLGKMLRATPLDPSQRLITRAEWKRGKQKRQKDEQGTRGSVRVGLPGL